MKYDGMAEAFPGKKGLVPLWVADMDFRTPDFIMDAIKKRCEHPIMGYTFGDDAYWNSILTWLKYKYLWETRKEWITYIPGIVKGIGFVVRCFTSPGDKVVIQPPVYHPFRIVPESMKRQIVYNPLKEENGSYSMDFDHLEQVMDGCKVLILCNPHNPGGIVWPKEDLVRLAEICAEHHVLVVSDEIHAETTYPTSRHHPFATVSETAANCSITFMAPSKTFNIAGIVSSYTIVPNEQIRKRFFEYLEAGELNHGTIFAYTATTAAYTYGAEWLQQMRTYVIENVDFVENYLKENIPQIKMLRPQASFLIWMDCRGVGLSQPELVSLFEDKAKLALNDGAIFGPGGEGHMRLNIGCPRSVLAKAMDALKKAIEEK